MCGWCVERLALEITARSQGGRYPSRECSDTIGRFFYLREVGDFSQGFIKVRRSAKRKGIDVVTDIPADLAFMRILETLFHHGFAARSYQELLRQKDIRSIINSACQDGRREQYLEAVPGLGVQDLSFLYRPETYLTADGARELRRPILLPACRTLLAHYRKWWLLGDSLQKNDLEERFEKTGILDPIEDIAHAEHDRFDLLLRALYFGLLFVGRFSAGAPLLRGIAETAPFGVPAFAGDDLWLQRVAALLWYDQKGFNGLLSDRPSFRTSLFYYIHLKRRFTPEQMKELIKVAESDPLIDKKDDAMTMKEWIEGELAQ